MSDYYLNINPMHKVPALQVEGNNIIYESLVCCEYLDKDNVLHCQDPLKKAYIKMWIQFYDNNVTTKKWNTLRNAKKGDVEKVK